MSIPDSISIFAEGTFEEQIQELVNYIVRSLSDEERTSFIRPFQEALHVSDGQKSLGEDPARRARIISMVLKEVKGLGEGSDKEIEGFFNLLYSHLFSLFPPGSPELKHHVEVLLRIASSPPTENPAIRYRILSNLFNTLPRTSGLRLPVYKTLLHVAVANESVDVLQISRANVEKWLSEWDISAEEKSQFWKSVVDALASSGQPEKSYEMRLPYIRSLPASSGIAKEEAVAAVAAALRLPNVFDFDPLFKLEAVIAAQSHPLFALLKIFLNDGLVEYKSWESSNGSALAQYELDAVQLERKIRLLTLASLAFENIGHDLPYNAISARLGVPVTDVERWAIDGIRAGLIAGKLAQPAQTLRVARATPRTFERAQWVALESHLVAWRNGLADVLEVVASARPQGRPAASEVEPQPKAVTT